MARKGNNNQAATTRPRGGRGTRADNKGLRRMRHGRPAAAAAAAAVVVAAAEQRVGGQVVALADE